MHPGNIAERDCTHACHVKHEYERPFQRRGCLNSREISPATKSSVVPPYQCVRVGISCFRFVRLQSHIRPSSRVSRAFRRIRLWEPVVRLSRSAAEVAGLHWQGFRTFTLHGVPAHRARARRVARRRRKGCEEAPEDYEAQSELVRMGLVGEECLYPRYCCVGLQVRAG